MKKLEAVEEARVIMTAGTEWGVFKWLMEKRKVRGIADRATAALNEAEDKVKATWSDDLKKAYNYLATQDGNATKGKRGAKTKDAVQEMLRNSTYRELILGPMIMKLGQLQA